MKRFAVKFRRILEIFAFQALWKKFWAHFPDWCVQQWSCLPWISDAFACEFYRKNFGRNSTMIYASINEADCREYQTHFGSSLPARFTKKVLGAFPRFVCPKTELFAVKFRRLLDLFALHALYKMFWAHFHDLCVQKWSCLLWNSDAFWKFSACKFYRKSPEHSFSICASKNEAVCCGVQTRFRSFRLSSFIKKKLWAHFPDLCVQK